MRRFWFLSRFCLNGEGRKEEGQEFRSLEVRHKLIALKIPNFTYTSIKNMKKQKKSKKIRIFLQKTVQHIVKYDVWPTKLNWTRHRPKSSNNIAMTKQLTKKVNFTYNLCEVYLKQDTPRKHLLETHPLHCGKKIKDKKCMEIDFDGLNLQWKVKPAQSNPRKIERIKSLLCKLNYLKIENNWRINPKLLRILMHYVTFKD